MQRSKTCPLCGKPNGCTLEEGKCWCYNRKFPKELLDRIPHDKKGKTCICENCLNDWIEHHPE